jgi:formamidopyrimidine-DNA glycosylase
MKPGEEAQWPPKYWKFQIETDSNPKVEVAFTDARRFGRVRLVDCPGDQIRKTSPLVENGPDPVIDVDIFTEKFLNSKMTSRHVSIKALLLDQSFLSGIGNWVGDEVLYQARLHPEQYSDEFTDAQIKALYKSIRHVCQTAVDLLGDSDQFPDDWIFNYRWGKGSKDAVTKLPNGEKLAFLTVGGRTSCYAPNLQKKTGRVAYGVKEQPAAKNAVKPSVAEAMEAAAAAQPKNKRKQSEVKSAPSEENATKKIKSAGRNTNLKESKSEELHDGVRRRSGRLRNIQSLH